MMQFLRKHQKKLFWAISILTIGSFVFVGTGNLLISPTKVVDKEIGQTFDGSPLTERELQVLVKFLNFSTQDLLKEDLMSTGLTAILAEKYFHQFKDEFSEKLQKAKNTSTYVHPQAPFLNAMQIWRHFVPTLAHHLYEVQQGDVSLKTFAAYSRLYLDQLSFPPEILGRILCYQQQQYRGIAPDRNLFDLRRLALFGHQSFEEWFGNKYTEILGKFIFNAALIAEEKGYKVSLTEAKAYLLQACLHMLQSKDPQQELSFADAHAFLKQELQLLNIEERKAAKICQKLLLACRLFNDVGQGVLVDPIAYQKFKDFSEEKASFEVYRLPLTALVKDFQTLIQLCYYRKTVFVDDDNLFEALPKYARSVEEIQKTHPELVVSRLDVEYKKITKEEVSNRLSLKQTWDYEITDEGWKALREQYPQIFFQDVKKEDRYQFLDNIDPQKRIDIDTFIRMQIVDQHPEWIQEALDLQQFHKQKIAFLPKGLVEGFSEVKNLEKLRQDIERASVKEPLMFLDDSTYYQIVVLESPLVKEILTFEEALRYQVLAPLVSKQLQTFYENLPSSKKHQVQIGVSNPADFKELQEKVALLYYQDELKFITREPLQIQDLVELQFRPLLEKVKIALQQQAELSAFIQESGQPLLDQWRLKKDIKTLKRSEITSLPKAEIFSLSSGSFLPIRKEKSGEMVLYYLTHKGPETADVQQEMIKGQRLLGIDARRLLMHQVLEKMDRSS